MAGADMRRIRPDVSRRHESECHDAAHGTPGLSRSSPAPSPAARPHATTPTRPARASPDSSRGCAAERLIRVVSYNIKYGRNITGAAALLRGRRAPQGRRRDRAAGDGRDGRGVPGPHARPQLRLLPRGRAPRRPSQLRQRHPQPWPIADDARSPAPPRPLPQDAAHRGGGHRPHLRRAARARVQRAPGDAGRSRPRRPSATRRRRSWTSAAGYPRVLVAGDFNGHGFIETGLHPRRLPLAHARRGPHDLAASPGTTCSRAGCARPAAPAWAPRPTRSRSATTCRSGPS